jgi:hypothetical protein
MVERPAMKQPQYFYLAGNPFDADGELSLFGEALQEGAFHGLVGLSTSENIIADVNQALLLTMRADDLLEANPGAGALLCSIDYNADSFAAQNALAARRVGELCCSGTATAEDDESYHDVLATQGVGAFMEQLVNTLNLTFSTNCADGKYWPEEFGYYPYAVFDQADRAWKQDGRYLFDNLTALARYLYYDAYTVDGRELIGLEEAFSRGLVQRRSGPPPPLHAWTDELRADLERRARRFRTEEEWVMQRGTLYLPLNTEFEVETWDEPLRSDIIEFVESLPWRFA